MAYAFGVEFRYLGEYPEVDHNTAGKAYTKARNIKQAVMKKLEGYLSMGRPSNTKKF